MGPQVKQELSDHTVDILEFNTSVHKWDLVKKFYEFRRDMFVDRLGWNLFSHDAMEFEQYDSFDTVYAVAHRDGQVIGGGRLRRADQRNGAYSYMIRDAVLGMLESLPTNLLNDEAPVDSSVWELTRFATNGDASVAPSLLHKINAFLFERNAEGCLCLGTPAFLRMAKMFNWEVTKMGPICSNHDGRFVVFKCGIIDPRLLAGAK